MEGVPGRAVNSTPLNSPPFLEALSSPFLSTFLLAILSSLLPVPFRPPFLFFSFLFVLFGCPVRGQLPCQVTLLVHSRCQGDDWRTHLKFKSSRRTRRERTALLAFPLAFALPRGALKCPLVRWWVMHGKSSLLGQTDTLHCTSELCNGGKGGFNFYVVYVCRPPRPSSKAKSPVALALGHPSPRTQKERALRCEVLV